MGIKEWFQARSDRRREENFLERPPTFSFAAFQGDVISALPELLNSRGYRILDVSRGRGTFQCLYLTLDDMMGGPKNEIAGKATLQVDTHSVLVDTEMSVGEADAKMIAFCAAHRTRAWCAIWERVSETALFKEFSGEAMVSRGCYAHGRVSGKQKDPPPALVRQPDHAGLVCALMDAGLPVSRLFAVIEATVYRVEYAPQE